MPAKFSKTQLLIVPRQLQRGQPVKALCQGGWQDSANRRKNITLLNITQLHLADLAGLVAIYGRVFPYMSTKTTKCTIRSGQLNITTTPIKSSLPTESKLCKAEATAIFPLC